MCVIYYSSGTWWVYLSSDNHSDNYCYRLPTSNRHVMPLGLTITVLIHWFMRKFMADIWFQSSNIPWLLLINYMNYQAASMVNSSLLFELFNFHFFLSNFIISCSLFYIASLWISCFLANKVLWAWSNDEHY
jgi:hypothetical protein